MNQLLIDTEKARLRKLGIASYTINGLTEDESIASELRGKYSWNYAAVVEPYSKTKGLTVRLFKLDPKRPTIPMGNSGCPSETFECLTGDPRDYFIKKFRERQALKGRKFKVKKMSMDRINFREVGKCAE